MEIPEDFRDTGELVGHTCSVQVDGEVVIRSDSGSASAKDFAKRNNVELANGDPLDGGFGTFEAYTWPGLAIASTPCTVPGVMNRFTVSLWADHPADAEESQQALAGIIQPYLQATLDQRRIPCEEYE